MTSRRFTALLVLLLVAGLSPAAQAQAPLRPRNAAILLFDGVQIIDYTGPYEVLGGVFLEGGPAFNVYTVAETAAPITTAMGMSVNPRYSFADAPAPDLLLLPGGGGFLPEHPGVGRASHDAEVMAWIRDGVASAEVVLTVCNGAFFLAKAGLLDGLTATTTAGLLEPLRQVAPKTQVVADQRFVDNGKVITTAGLSSGIDGALHVVERLFGRGTAQMRALGMEYRWDPEGTWARAALADRYLRFNFEGFDDARWTSLSREGDRDHWENRWSIEMDRPAEEVLALLDATLEANRTYVPTTVKWTRAATPAPGPTPASRWTFTDEQGQVWTGIARVEPAPDRPHGYTLSLRVDRGTPAS
jgi:putative intracellular protease/amidase